MAKVFATLREDNKVVLKTWSSAAAFLKTETWLDEKFITVTTSDDFKGKGSFPLCPMYDEEIEVTTSKPQGNGFNIIYKENDVASHNLLFQARNQYLGIKRDK